MKSLVKWSRSKDGRARSKCGKYIIKPARRNNKDVKGHYECWHFSLRYLCTFKTPTECKALIEVLEYLGDEKTRVERISIVEAFVYLTHGAGKEKYGYGGEKRFRPDLDLMRVTAKGVNDV